MQYLQEPFFNDLRTQQQLGYVVFSRPVNTRDVIGAQFLVQSPTRSCQYQAHSINEFLVQMKAKVEQLSESEFETQRQAVLVKLQEKDISLSKQHARHWTEIQTHKYTFDRQQQEIAELSDVSLADFKSHFL